MKTMPTLAIRACRCLPATVLALALAGAPTVAFAEVFNAITWESAHTISSDSDVRTTGSLVVAFSVGAKGVVTGTTVNTVPFAAFGWDGGYQTSDTISNVFFHETDPNLTLAPGNTGSGSLPFSGLSSAYRSLLSECGQSVGDQTLQINVGGLTPGQQYLIQAWSSDATGFQIGTTRYSGLGDSGSYVDLLDNVNSAAGGLGQYAVGTFTAASSTLVLELNGQSGALPLVNAFQVRAVPEPSTYVLAGIGAALVGVARCRNRGRFARWTAR